MHHAATPTAPTAAELLRLLPDDHLHRALGHPARLRALVELERRPLAAREIGVLVGLSPQAMGWHLHRLADGRLIRAVDSRRRRAFEETLWRANYPGWGRLSALIHGLSAEGVALRKQQRIAAAREHERAVLAASASAAPARARVRA